MPFMVNSTCYPDSLSAFDGWSQQFPTPPDSNGVIWFINAATISTAGVITGTLKGSGSATKTTAIVGVSLPACTAQNNSYVFDKMPLQDILFIAALCVVAFLGFLSGRAR